MCVVSFGNILINFDATPGHIVNHPIISPQAIPSGFEPHTAANFMVWGTDDGTQQPCNIILNEDGTIEIYKTCTANFSASSTNGIYGTHLTYNTIFAVGPG